MFGSYSTPMVVLERRIAVGYICGGRRVAGYGQRPCFIPGTQVVQSRLHIYLAYTVKFSRQNGQVSCCGRQCWSTVAEQ
jgi:hypothetical protein